MDKTNEPIDYLLLVGDDRHRVTVPKDIVKNLGLESGDNIKITYVKVDKYGKQPTLLPFVSIQPIDDIHRFKITSNVKNYLELKRGDYFRAMIEKYA
ncbi:MAG: hypothetical protein ABH828_03150 [archaeon]